MTEIEKETGMTDVECEYWDEYITKNPVRLGPDLATLGIKPGYAYNYLPELCTPSRLAQPPSFRYRKFKEV